MRSGQHIAVPALIGEIIRALKNQSGLQCITKSLSLLTGPRCSGLRTGFFISLASVFLVSIVLCACVSDFGEFGVFVLFHFS